MTRAPGPDARPKSVGGFSLPEVLIVCAILAIIAAPITLYLRRTTQSFTIQNRQTESAAAVRTAFIDIERHFAEMTELTDCAEDLAGVEFLMDSYMMPGHAKDGNNDGDLALWGSPSNAPLTNQQDPDDDNDAPAVDTTRPPVPGAFWMVGDDLQDDDDNGNGRVDMQVRYRLEGTDLVRDTNVDEDGWGQNRQILLKNVKTFRLDYYTSNAHRILHRPKLVNTDNGVNGVPGDGDEGEGDKIITRQEIDMTNPANGGHGNRSGAAANYHLDTPQERRYVTSIEIFIEQDANGDGTADADMRTFIAPVLLPLRHPEWP